MLSFHVLIEANEDQIPYIKKLMSNYDRYIGKTFVTYEGNTDKDLQTFEAIEREAYDNNEMEIL